MLSGCSRCCCWSGQLPLTNATNGLDRSLPTPDDNMRIKLAVTVAIGVFTPAVAASWATPPSGQSGEWTVKGICKRLVVANENLLSDCTGEVTRTRTSDGVVTLQFSTGRGKLIFRARESTARLWQGYRSVLEVYEMAFEAPGQGAIAAYGSCEYGAPYVGQATINCRGGNGSFKTWAATVKTDGPLPVPDSEYIAPRINSVHD